MDLQFTGRISKEFPHKSGVSKTTGNPWEIAEFLIEEEGQQYNKRMVFQVSGPDRIKTMNIKVGEFVTVHFDVDAHEWQGKFYNSISAYRVDKQGQQQAQPQGQSAPQAQAPAQQAPQAAPATPAVGSQPASTGADDQLPF